MKAVATAINVAALSCWSESHISFYRFTNGMEAKVDSVSLGPPKNLKLKTYLAGLDKMIQFYLRRSKQVKA